MSFNFWRPRAEGLIHGAVELKIRKTQCSEVDARLAVRRWVLDNKGVDIQQPERLSRADWMSLVLLFHENGLEDI